MFQDQQRRFLRNQCHPPTLVTNRGWQSRTTIIGSSETRLSNKYCLSTTSWGTVAMRACVFVSGRTFPNRSLKLGFAFISEGHGVTIHPTSRTRGWVVIGFHRLAPAPNKWALRVLSSWLDICLTMRFSTYCVISRTRDSLSVGRIREHSLNLRTK